jgi:hypothetical protein
MLSTSANLINAPEHRFQHTTKAHHFQPVRWNRNVNLNIFLKAIGEFLIDLPILQSIIAYSQATTSYENIC